MTTPTQAVLKRLAGPLLVQSTDGTGGEVVAYTCTGTGILNAVIKHVRFSMPKTGTAQEVSWGILPSGGTIGVTTRWLLESMDLGPKDPVTDNVSQIMNPGDKIIVKVTDANVTVTISGVELI